MEKLITTLLTDESQRFFVLSIFAVVVLAIALVIVASISRVRFFKHLFYDLKQINKEKESEVEKLRREKQAIRTKNKILEEKLSLLDTTKIELEKQKAIIATIQERADALEESQREESQIAQTKTKEYQDMQYKFRGLQKRNEVLVEENSSFRNEIKNFHLKTKELESIVFKKLVDNSADIAPADIEKMALDILEKNQNFFDSIKDQTLHRDLLPLLEDILNHQRELSHEYAKRISKDMDLCNALIFNIDLHRRVEIQERIVYDKFKEDKKLRDLAKEVTISMIKLSQVGKKHIDTIQGELNMFDLLLPYESSIIIDAGVSLESYGLYMDAQKPSEQERLLKDFLKTFQSHIDKLIKKSAQSEHKFLLMLVPHKDAVDLLLKHKSTLYDLAYKQGVVIISSAQLLTLLQSVARLWGYYYNIERVESLQLSTEKLEDQLLRVATQISSVAQKLEMMQESLIPSHITQEKEMQ